MKTLTILGSTGSIGTQTLDVADQHPGDFTIAALAAGSNIRLLEQQIRKYRPVLAAVWDEDRARELRGRVADLNVKICSGMDGLIEAATLEQTDIVVGAIVGMIGILPVIRAIKAGKDIALANKETIVTAGHIIMPLARRYGVRILPVDSEHSAIFQCLHGENHGDLKRILLTASGGPFRGYTREQLENVSLEEALHNPNWVMGRKVTIDSASLVNKGLEVMEARWLFDVKPEQIQVVVHPQSVVHSAVEFQDHAVIAQMGCPDMRLPIQYALYYPHRMPLHVEELDLFAVGSLTFEKPDTSTFRGLALAYQALQAGGSMPSVFNAANEKAVAMLLAGRIRFLDIYEIIEECMARHRVIKDPSLSEILSVQEETGCFIESRWRSCGLS